MRPPLIEKGEVAFEPRAHRRDGLVRAQIHVLVFDGAPEPFDKDVVAPAAAAVHADLDVMRAQHVEKRRARELRALVGVADHRRAEAISRRFERRDAAVGGERRRNPPREDFARRPVHDRAPEDEAARHRDVRNIRGPDVVRALHQQATQQIRKDRMLRGPLTRARSATDRADPHTAHEGPHMIPSDGDALAP